MPASPADSSRYFNVERIPASDLDALLDATEREGHRLIHLRVERRAGSTGAFLYTPFFKHGARVKTAKAKKAKG